MIVLSPKCSDWIDLNSQIVPAGPSPARSTKASMASARKPSSASRRPRTLTFATDGDTCARIPPPDCATGPARPVSSRSTGAGQDLDENRRVLRLIEPHRRIGHADRHDVADPVAAARRR